MRINLYDQVQALMSVEPLDKLRVYLSQATLPPMKLAPQAPQLPAPGHHSHRNILSVTPQHYRLLEKMYQIEPATFKSSLKTVLNMHVTQAKIQTLDHDDIENVTIPCPPGFQLAVSPPKKPANIEQLCRWVSQFPLDSAQSVMHNVFPQTEDWSFSSVKADVDEDIFQSYVWSPTATTANATGGPGSVTVFVQPPWILSQKDLESFVNCDILRRVDEISCMNEDDRPNAYVSKERLWAKIWDECQRNGSHYFVLTNYWGWVFGVFTAGRTVGLVSDFVRGDQTSPTVLECLVYWLLSAMGFEGGWEVPEVSEEPQFMETPCLVGDLLPPDLFHYGRDRQVAEPFLPSAGNLPVPRPSQRIYTAPSESEFSAHSSARITQSDVDDIEDQIAVEQYLTQQIPVRELPEVNPYAPPTRSLVVRNRGVGSWRSRVRSGSPSPTEASDLSTSTIKDFGDHEYVNGEWVRQ